MLLPSDLSFECTSSISVSIEAPDVSVMLPTYLQPLSVSLSQTLSGCPLWVAISTVMNLPYIIYSRSFWPFPRGNTRGEIPPGSLVLLVGVKKKKSCCNFNHPNIAWFIINEGWTKLQLSEIKQRGKRRVIRPLGIGCPPSSETCYDKARDGWSRGRKSPLLALFWVCYCLAVVLEKDSRDCYWRSWIWLTESELQKVAAKCDQTYRQTETQASEGY